MNIILDNNVIIAAFASRGLCQSIFELCLDRYSIFISDYILKEIGVNLQKKINMSKSKTDAFLEYLREYSTVLECENLKKPVCRDRNENHILTLAKCTDADYIITGDDDLLTLKRFESTAIVSPRGFWDIVRKNTGSKL